MEKFVTRSVELFDTEGYRFHANLTSVTGETRVAVEVHEYSTITHKRVVLHFKETESDRNFSIVLSPLGALALVRRLVDVLDACQREGVEVPGLHSDLAYKAARHVIDGLPIPEEDLDALASCACSAYQEVIG